ncbi:MAG TPA: hypothetical protein ENJ09_14930 [Planctomycetes bacterium]|nr:hypothetical protein [Planctomycetota bacterium]
MKFTRWKLHRTKGASGPGGAHEGQVPSGFRALERELEELDEPGACDVRDRLLAHGGSLEFTGTLVRAVRLKGKRGAHAIDAAAELIGDAFAIQPSPKLRRGSEKPQLFAFIGPTGSGKTTVLAKLARRLAKAGRRVLLASLDGAGASELSADLATGRIEADVDRTELPLRVVRSAEHLARRIAEMEDLDVVLIDTPGMSPRDHKGLDRLARELDRFGTSGQLDVYLTLPATMSRAAISIVRKSFAPTAPTACIITKLDETDEPLTVLEETVRAHLRIAFLTDGPDIRGDLRRPCAEAFADLALRGKLA